MSISSQNEFDHSSGAIEAEKTLRLVASLPAPDGIEERVKAALQTAPRSSQVIRWPLAAGQGWMHGSAMRAAAAAAIVIVVAGGGWEVYSHIRVAASPAAIVVPQPISGSSGFSTAAARRTPQTLERPSVALPVTIQQKANDTEVVPQIRNHHQKMKKPNLSAPAAQR
jgi:hypothetical protein